MQVYAVSDIHVDYPENHQWIMAISSEDYRNDVLLLAGDVSDNLDMLAEVLAHLVTCFAQVFFVPGNHDLWVRKQDYSCSLEKLAAIEELCASLGVKTETEHLPGVSIVPMHSWYDFSFGIPDRYLRRAWRDFRACQWPEHLDNEEAITQHFLARNEAHLNVESECVISFSHFLPRLDVMPEQIPQHRRKVYPVLGSDSLDEQLRRLQPKANTAKQDK